MKKTHPKTFTHLARRTSDKPLRNSGIFSGGNGSQAKPSRQKMDSTPAPSPPMEMSKKSADKGALRYAMDVGPHKKTPHMTGKGGVETLNYSLDNKQSMKMGRAKTGSTKNLRAYADHGEGHKGPRHASTGSANSLRRGAVAVKQKKG